MPVQAILPLVVIALGFVIYCLMDLRNASVEYLPKWAWAVVIILSVPAGGIIYLAFGRQHR